MAIYKWYISGTYWQLGNQETPLTNGPTFRAKKNLGWSYNYLQKLDHGLQVGNPVIFVRSWARGVFNHRNEIHCSWISWPILRFGEPGSLGLMIQGFKMRFGLRTCRHPPNIFILFFPGILRKPTAPTRITNWPIFIWMYLEDHPS